MTKQREWQLIQKSKGLCVLCAKKACKRKDGKPGSLCIHHKKRDAVRARNAQRKKRGIPLDAPLYARGNP